MNRTRKIMYLTRFLGQTRALVLTALIHQYPQKAQPEQSGYFYADHAGIRKMIGMPKSIYISALQSLQEEKLLTLGRSPHPGGGKGDKLFVRIEFQAIETYLRYAWLRWAIRQVIMFIRKAPLRQAVKRLRAMGA